MRQRKAKRQKTIKYQNSEFYYDDCAICGAMKEAEDRWRDLSLEELKEAFKKANKQK